MPLEHRYHLMMLSLTTLSWIESSLGRLHSAINLLPT